jgi:3-hydroxyisobutyrate dehydrogenase
MQVAVLGTGIMGAPIARNIARAGHEVIVWNRTREKAEAIDGPEVAAAPAEAVREAEVVVTMLSEGDAVREVMTGGALGAFAPGAIWLQTSTVGLAALEELAALAGGAGAPFVDCPVLGTKKPAEEAQLTVLTRRRCSRCSTGTRSGPPMHS